MSNDSFVSHLHPCPSCSTPVANVARICHNCGIEQPSFHAEAYRKLLAAQEIAHPAARAQISEEKEPESEPRHSPFRKLALRLRQQQ